MLYQINAANNTLFLNKQICYMYSEQISAIIYIHLISELMKRIRVIYIKQLCPFWNENALGSYCCYATIVHKIYQKKKFT